MLCLLDARTGAYAEIRPARRGLLRVCVHAPPPDGEPDVTGLRMLLVADVLARTAGVGGLQVLTALAFPGRPPEQPAFFERGAAALGIHPPAARVRPAEAEASLAGPVDVRVVADGSGMDDGPGGPVVRVGAARVRGAGNDGEPAPEALLGRRGRDPLAVRLALMSFRHHHAADLTAEALASAQETIGNWRHRVAEWAESPSRPMPERVAQAARAAFGRLDTRLALSLLHGLETDAAVPAGAKFETFAYADRILSLELAREIGRAR